MLNDVDIYKQENDDTCTLTSAKIGQKASRFLKEQGIHRTRKRRQVVSFGWFQTKWSVGLPRTFQFQVFPDDRGENQIWTHLKRAHVKTCLLCSLYWGRDSITESTKLFFTDLNIQRNWEISGWIIFPWQWNFYFVVETEKWSRTNCDDS